MLHRKPWTTATSPSKATIMLYPSPLRAAPSKITIPASGSALAFSSDMLVRARTTSSQSRLSSPPPPPQDELDRRDRRERDRMNTALRPQWGTPRFMKKTLRERREESGLGQLYPQKGVVRRVRRPEPEEGDESV